MAAPESSLRMNKNTNGIPTLCGRWGGRGHLSGQCELKCRAPFRIGRRPQRASVRLDNSPTDGQTHTGALFLGGEEGIEYAIDFSRREADTGIPHRNEQLSIRGPLRADGQFTL